MGELILCSRKPAAIPYYLEDVGINIFSLEELCYYMSSNRYLLGPEFMKEELCTWIGKELDLTELSGHLRELCREKGDLSSFVQSILKETGYCTPSEVKQILETIREMENKSEFECGKIRGDRHLEAHRYVSSVYEYRRLLTMEEKNPILIGNVWHNLGTAYARLFLYEEAVSCFERAYEKNENPESLRECLFACLCGKEESTFMRVTEKFQVTEELEREIRQEWFHMNQAQESSPTVLEVEELFRRGTEHDIAERLLAWKNDYRSSCRV